MSGAEHLHAAILECRVVKCDPAADNLDICLAVEVSVAAGSAISGTHVVVRSGTASEQ
eukprot:SAG22_NODE_17190_length_310_cov_0.654028_1_plen_57_part_10